MIQVFGDIGYAGNLHVRILIWVHAWHFATAAEAVDRVTLAAYEGAVLRVNMPQDIPATSAQVGRSGAREHHEHHLFTIASIQIPLFHCPQNATSLIPVCPYLRPRTAAIPLPTHGSPCRHCRLVQWASKGAADVGASIP